MNETVLIEPRPRASRRAARGFTLIELLVVLVVIGVVVAAIQLNLFSDDARRLRQEGERLAALLTALADEAVTGASPLAVSFDADGYAFWERDQSGEDKRDAYAPRRQQATTWRSRPGDELFAGRKMGEGIRIVEVRIRQRVVSLATKAPERIVFSPSGIHSPFSVVLALNDLRVVVVADAIGNLRVEDDVGEDDGR